MSASFEQLFALFALHASRHARALPFGHSTTCAGAFAFGVVHLPSIITRPVGHTSRSSTSDLAVSFVSFLSFFAVSIGKSSTRMSAPHCFGAVGLSGVADAQSVS